MQPKVELIRMRNLGETVDDSILFFKQNFKPLFKAYFAICGLFLAAGIITSVFGLTQQYRLQNQFESTLTPTYFLTVLLVLLNFIFSILTTLSFVALYQANEKRAPSIQEVWVYVKYYLLRMLGSSVVLLALLAIGTVICVLPGIYFFPVMLLVMAVMILDNANFGVAFSQAFRLIKDRWWHLFSVLMVMTVILFAATILLCIPIFIIAGLVLALTNANDKQTLEIALAITLNLLQLLGLLPIVAVALAYYSFTEQKDDNSLLQRIEMIGKIKPSFIDQSLSEEY